MKASAFLNNDAWVIVAGAGEALIPLPDPGE
jgi:hypothetical protein